ncbi:MAG: hypothetical protein E6J56_22145 [Deltaproteobacteria bacterium]|nr:MAG: hypothetical protein E6J56_22145 [Deltaproteobacteria bacterium]
MKARGIPWPRVMGQANADGEFRIAARFWRIRLRLDLGSESVRLTVEDGAIRAIEPCASDGACDVSVSGDRDSWARLLEAAPLWQDLFGAAGRGDFAIATSDPEAFYAYYPAVRRLVDLLRRESGS